MNDFDMWLGEQAAADEPSDSYTTHCSGASSIPVPQESFNPCIIAYSVEKDDTRILSHQDEVKIIHFEFGSRVRFDSPYQILNDEWNLIENWFIEESNGAPEGVNKPVYSNFDFWWYDTNGQMLSTAYGAAVSYRFCSCLCCSLLAAISCVV